MPQTKPHRKFENKEVKKIQCANRNRYKGVEAIDSNIRENRILSKKN